MEELVNLGLLVAKIRERFYTIVNLSSRFNPISVVNVKQMRTLRLLNSGSRSLDLEAVECLKQRGIVGCSDDLKFPSVSKSINLWVHLTNACTLKCTYCSIHKNPVSMDSETLDVLEEKLVEAVEEGELKKVVLRLSGGEPLLKFLKIKDFVVRLKKRLAGCDLRFSIITNLTLLPDGFVPFVKQHKIGLAVSLDGLGYFNSARKFSSGEGSFDVVIENLKVLFEEGISPMILTVMSNDNIEGLPFLVRFLIDWNLKFRIQTIKGDGSFYTLENLRILRHIYDMFDSAIDDGYDFVGLHHLADLNISKLSYNACGSGIYGAALNHDGKMHFCPHQMDGVGFGDVRGDVGLMDMMRGSGFERLHSKPPHCMSCRYSKICSGGCPISNQANCGLFKDFIPVIYRLIGKQKLIGMLAKRKSCVMSG